jgi:hypothetical protein
MKKNNQGFFKKSHALQKFYFSQNFSQNFQPDQYLKTRTKPICLTSSHSKPRSNYFFKNCLTSIRVKRIFSFPSSPIDKFFPKNLTFSHSRLFICSFHISKSKIISKTLVFGFSGLEIDFPVQSYFEVKTKDKNRTSLTSPSPNSDESDKSNSCASGIRHSNGFLSLDDFTDNDEPILVLLRNAHFIPPRILTPLLAQAIEPMSSTLTTMGFKSKKKPIKYSYISIWRNQVHRLNDSYGTAWTEDDEADLDFDDWVDIIATPTSSDLKPLPSSSPTSDPSHPATRGLVTTSLNVQTEPPTTESYVYRPAACSDPMTTPVISLLPDLSFAPALSPRNLTTYSHELFSTTDNHELSSIPKPIIKEGESSEETSCPDVTLNMLPTFSPTVVPIWDSTEGLEVKHVLTCSATLPPSPVSPPLVVNLADNEPYLSLSSLETPCEYPWDFATPVACECSCDPLPDPVDTLLPLRSYVTIVTLPDHIDAPSKRVPMHTAPKSKRIPLNPLALDFRPTTSGLHLHPFVGLEERNTENYLIRQHLDHFQRQWPNLNPHALDFSPTNPTLPLLPSSTPPPNSMTQLRTPLNPYALNFKPTTLDHFTRPTLYSLPSHHPNTAKLSKPPLHRRYPASLPIKRTSKLPSCQPFSLSLSERRGRRPPCVSPLQNPLSRPTKHKTNKQEHWTFRLRKDYLPCSAARRRLLRVPLIRRPPPLQISAGRRRLRTTWRRPPSPLRARFKYRQTKNRIRPIILSVTDHTSSNKKLEENKTTTNRLPCFDFFDVLPGYKIYLYWEVKAG